MTDHNPMVWLNRNVSSNPRLLRWALALQPYNFRIVHRSDIIKMGRTILLERRQSESVGRRNSRSTFLRSDWPRPFARREVGVEMDWVDPKINDPRSGRSKERFN
ncbi:hypothetical protein TNCV_1605641 [Trichonephila clavipes]|nr:hypothetical protein TNCV_1605641 [Trichonephila clavipes]